MDVIWISWQASDYFDALSTTIRKGHQTQILIFWQDESALFLEELRNLSLKAFFVIDQPPALCNLLVL